MLPSAKLHSKNDRLMENQDWGILLKMYRILYPNPQKLNNTS